PFYSGNGTVFELPGGSNTITTLASFDGTNGAIPGLSYVSAGTAPAYPGGLALDSSGNLFGTTYSGGPSNYGTVFELPSGSGTLVGIASNTVFEVQPGSGTVATLVDFGPDPKDGEPNGNLVLDSSGNLFGTCLLNGVNNNGAVFEIQQGSGAITGLANFAA